MKTSLPLTIAFDIPAYWTPEQALAVFELLDDLHERIWRQYKLQLMDLIRKQRQPISSESGDSQIDDPTF